MFAQTHHNIDPLSLILTSERKVSSEKFLLFKATHTGMRCGLLSLSGCCCSTSIEKLQVLISLCEAALILFGTSNTVIPKDHIVRYVNYNQRHILRLIQHLFFWINLHGWPNALKGLENIFSVFNIWMIHTQDLSHGLIEKIKLCLSHASLLISGMQKFCIWVWAWRERRLWPTLPPDRHQAAEVSLCSYVLWGRTGTIYMSVDAFRF